MTTTRQQRSPMGAFYRTPMGAFGPGVPEEEPPPIITGTVQTLAQINLTWMWLTATCQQAVVTLNPVVPTTRFRINLSGVDASITFEQIRSATYRGLTSGFTYTPETETPDYICGEWTQLPAARSKIEDGVEGDPIGFPNYFYYDLAEEITKSFTDVRIEAWYTLGNHGFINGEGITTAPP